MKQQKLTGYRPNYPRKALRGAALTAAALVAISGAAGCRKVDLSAVGFETVMTPPPEELVLDGEVAIPEPTEEPALMGESILADPGEYVDESSMGKPLEGGPDIVGGITVEEPEETPLGTTGVLLMPTAAPEA